MDPGGTLDLLEALAELPAPPPVHLIPRAGIDEHTQAVLALVRGNPLHDRDRERIVRAIVTDARAHDGHVDPNRVRRALTHDSGEDLLVYPRVIGAVYSALTATGALVFTGYVDSDDAHGKNRGKPARCYLLTRLPHEGDHR